MRRALIAAALTAVATPALTQDASFDCAAAASVVEKTICDNHNYHLAYRDGVLGKLYATLKSQGGHDDVLGGQKAWLKSRDSCKSDVDCLASRYDERIAVLAGAGGDTERLTGVYRYTHGADGGGELWIVREPGGTAMGRIESVTGPNAHTCDVEFSGVTEEGGVWSWTDTDEDSEGNVCKIRFEVGGETIAVSSDACMTYCGVQGGFDETYARVK